MVAVEIGEAPFPFGIMLVEGGGRTRRGHAGDWDPSRHGIAGGELNGRGIQRG